MEGTMLKLLWAIINEYYTHKVEVKGKCLFYVPFDTHVFTFDIST